MILVVYYSLGGNTETLVKRIEDSLIFLEQDYESLALGKHTKFDSLNIEKYKLVLLGTPTYGGGNCPKVVLDFLRHIIKLNNFILPPFSVFGTGETQWGERMYCRAVDEMEHHLNKRTKVIKKLKIEQRPVSKYQINKINEFVEQSIKEVTEWN